MVPSLITDIVLKLVTVYLPLIYYYFLGQEEGGWGRRWGSGRGQGWGRWSQGGGKGGGRGREERWGNQARGGKTRGHQGDKGGN